MRLDQLKALISRAAHAGTPEEEARSCGVLAARAILEAGYEIVEPGTTATLQRCVVRPATNGPSGAPASAPKVIRVKYAQRCRHCFAEIDSGTKAAWWRGWGVMHVACARKAAA